MRLLDGQATQQQLAQPRTPSTTPPIWQGRAHGESAAILGRNPDGTFQVIIQGQEKTRTERDVAYMTGLKKGPLYEMLGQATQQQLAHLARPRRSRRKRRHPGKKPRRHLPGEPQRRRKDLQRTPGRRHDQLEKKPPL